MTDSFAGGINEKLSRANENIRNLESEIARFFEESEYPVICDDDLQPIPKAIKYHESRLIPLRFSVLSGEIIHHLRSCLDHVIWHFSRDTYRRKNIAFIGFPILNERPSEKDLPTKYERKVKGITDPRVLDLIERLQPYHSSDPIDSHLSILHKLDIIDKHRGLVIVASTAAFHVPNDFLGRIQDQGGIPEHVTPDLISDFKRHCKLVPQVAFNNFGRSEVEPVAQGLGKLQNYLCRVLSMFVSLDERT